MVAFLANFLFTAVRMFGTVSKAKEAKAIGRYGAGVGGVMYIWDLLENCFDQSQEKVDPVKCGKSVFLKVASMGLAVMHKYYTGAWW